LRGIATTHFLLLKNWRAAIFPRAKRPQISPTMDICLLIAGRPGFWGAGISPRQRYRYGRGLRNLGQLEPPYESLKDIPEILTASVTDDKLWHGNSAPRRSAPGWEADGDGENH